MTREPAAPSQSDNYSLTSCAKMTNEEKMFLFVWVKLSGLPHVHYKHFTKKMCHKADDSQGNEYDSVVQESHVKNTVYCSGTRLLKHV